MSFLRTFLLSSVSLWAVNCATPAMSQSQPATAPVTSNDYFFGDSDLEQGNFQIIAGQTAQDSAPYYCAGGLCRDSNGPVWAEVLNPAVRPVLAEDRPRGSLNFAVSGARMDLQGDPALPVPTGVSTQIGWFETLQKSGTVAVSPSDRFFIHAGSNDLVGLLNGEDPAAVQSGIIAAASANVERLAKAGARRIVIADVQSVQYLPLFAGADLAGVRQALGGYVSATNAALSVALQASKATLPAGTTLVMVKQKPFFAALSRDYAALGFTAPDEACYDVATGSLCSANPAEQNRLPFFDSNHLSAAGHQLLAQWYRATLAAADGTAAQDAGRMPDLILVQRQNTRAFTVDAREQMAADGRRAHLFASPFRSSGRLAGNASASAVNMEMDGGLLGLQVPLGQRGFVGVSGDWSRSTADIGAQSHLTNRQWGLSLFGGLDLKTAQISAHITYARPDLALTRQPTAFASVIARAQTSGRSLEGSLSIAGVTQFGPLRIISSLGLTFEQVQLERFTEAGADGLNLAIGRQRAARLLLETTTKASVSVFEGAQNLAVRPFVSLAHRARLAGGKHDILSQLTDNLADPVKTRISGPGKDRLGVGGGVDVLAGKRFAFGASYERDFAGSERNRNTATLRLTLSF
ncbi:phospholipase/lecithinase/hemolysin/uncharacterized protein YhjY with autotransporter beta-barrel domain [Sphingomonas sp. UYAg733]